MLKNNLEVPFNFIVVMEVVNTLLKLFTIIAKKIASINNLHNLTYMPHQNGVAQ
jgi:hypothetical protein